MTWTEAELAVENGSRVGRVGNSAYVEKMMPTYKSLVTGDTIAPHANRWEPCKYNPVNNDFEQYYTPDEESAAATDWEIRTV
jgi:hypothetical protein